MKLTLLLLTSLITVFSVFSQTYEWGKKWGYNAGTSELVFAMDIAADDQGNSYALSFGDTQVDFDPSANTLMGPTVACGAVSKFDPSGNLVWVKFISRVSGTSPSCIPEAIYVANNTLYISGEFNGTYDFNPGAGVNTLGTTTSRVFVQKLDLDGNYISAEAYLGQYCTIKDITVDNNQNIYLAGRFGQNLSFGSSNLVNSGSSDALLAKIDNTGNAVWAVGYGGAIDDAANAVSVKSNGNVIVVGDFNGTADFDPTSGTNFVSSNSSSYDFFLQELTTNGTVLNTFTGGGSDSDRFNSVFIDEMDNIYVGGHLYGSVDLDPSMNSTMIGGTGQVGVVAKYSSNLSFLWGSVFDNQSASTSSSSVLDLVVDVSSNVYLSGRFNGTIDLNTSLLQDQFITAGGTTSNSFFAKLNSSGQSVWSGGFIGVTDGYNVPNGIAYGNGGLYVAGEFKSTVDFDPSTNTANLTSAYSSNGATPRETAYLVKLTTCESTSSTISPTACKSYIAPDGQEYTQSGVYSAVIPNEEGCDSLIMINLTIENVNTGISVSGITLSATASGMQYQWLNCATNEITGLPTTQSFTPSNNGEYAVIVYDGNCSDTSECITISSVSIMEDHISNFTVSPNPVSSFALVEGISSTLTNEIELITSTGVVILKLKNTGDQVLLDLSHLSAGIYFVKIGSRVVRLIKE